MVHSNKRCNTKTHCSTAVGAMASWMVIYNFHVCMTGGKAFGVEEGEGLLYSQCFWYCTNEDISCLSQPSLRLGLFLFVIYSLTTDPSIYFLRAQEQWHISKYVREQTYRTWAPWATDIHSCKARVNLGQLSVQWYSFPFTTTGWAATYVQSSKSFIKVAGAGHVQAQLTRTQVFMRLLLL